MAVSLKRVPLQTRGYSQTEARRLARELGGVAVPARWRPAQSAWEFGGRGWNPAGLPHIVVLPLLGARSKTTYVVLADNTAPVKTADEAQTEFEQRT